MALVYRVRRQAPELVAPARPTPRELKPLSNLDDQEGHRFHIPVLFMYRNNPSMEGKDPVKVIREAIAQALVFYYPFAGRLIEGPGRKLSVDCTGEGVMFIEADAEIALDDFGAPLQPPFPCYEELFYHHAPGRVIDSPLLLFQVTRLKCGGFILHLQFNHTMSDGYGIVMFLKTIGEIACGALAPPTPPCWNRELFFCARDPPRVKHPYRDRDHDHDTPYVPFDDIVEKSFFFGPSQISALRRLVPHNPRRRCSTFDLLTACLWRCHTTALKFDPKDDVFLLFLVNARGLGLDPPLPPGYYGNAAVVLVVTTAAENLICRNSFGYALELIRKARADVTEEYLQSYVDLIAVKGFYPLPGVTGGQCLFVSDLRAVRVAEVDLGWGRAAYGGPVVNATEAVQGLTAYYTPSKNQQGQEGIVVKMSFPRPAMKIFENELDSMLYDKTQNSRLMIKSGL